MNLARIVYEKVSLRRPGGILGPSQRGLGASQEPPGTSSERLGSLLGASAMIKSHPEAT